MFQNVLFHSLILSCSTCKSACFRCLQLQHLGRADSFPEPLRLTALGRCSGEGRSAWRGSWRSRPLLPLDQCAGGQVGGHRRGSPWRQTLQVPERVTRARSPGRQKRDRRQRAGQQLSPYELAGQQAEQGRRCKIRLSFTVFSLLCRLASGPQELQKR